jgi:hypothetical protein
MAAVSWLSTPLPLSKKGSEQTGSLGPSFQEVTTTAAISLSARSRY